MSDQPDSYDNIKRRRRKPLKALHHFRELIRNKEDTTQVFYIIDALNGNSFQNEFKKFMRSEKGQARVEENRYLPPLLDNHDWLRSLPEGSLGRAHAQRSGLGVIFIAYGAALEIRKTAPKGAPILKSIREARKMGKAAKDIVYEDLMALLPLPLEEVRERLNITLPTAYHEAHRMMRHDGMDPYDMIGTQTA